MQYGGGAGVLYPPQPSPIPIPDINIPTPKDVGNWLDEVFGKQPGTKSGGPDPNDPENFEKWKKVGKRWDKNGKRVQDKESKMQTM